MLNNEIGTHLLTGDRHKLKYIQENLSHFSLEGNDGVTFHVLEI